MKKIKLLLVTIAIIASYSLSAQMAVTTDGSSADASAMFEVKSSDKGFLPPRMTTAEIGNIASPANGLFVFNTTDNKAYIFVSADNEWKELNYGAGTITGPFICGETLIDDRDSKSYTTVEIGSQCWMAENLNIGTMINSANGGTNGDGEQTNNVIIEKYCYDNSTSHCDTYGGMYQWDEMMQYVSTEGTQGLCPTGWHLPTDTEWKTMEMQLGMSQSEADDVGWRGTDEGEKMKSTSGWNNDGNGTNSSGFNGLPGGFRNGVNYSVPFDDLGVNCYLWTSTEDSGADRWSRYLSYWTDQVLRGSGFKTDGRSVRCLKN